MENQSTETVGGGGGAGGGGGQWMVQDPATGNVYPIAQAGQYPNGNILAPDGTWYSHDAGMSAYQQQSASQTQPGGAQQDPPGIQQVGVAHDGVPIYQDSTGQYYTRNADGSYTPQNLTAADFAGAGDLGGGTTPPPPTTGGGGGGGGGGGSMISPFPGVYTPPANTGVPMNPSLPLPDVNQYRAPSMTDWLAQQFPDLAGQWKPPTLADAQNDPGFQFVQQEGQQGLERSAAARGVLNTGGTLQDIARWNQALADTQYSNVYNRSLQTWAQNLANAANQYQSYAKTQFQDPFSQAMQVYGAGQQNWLAQMNEIQRQNELSYNQSWDRYKFDYQRWLDRNNLSIQMNTL